MRNVFDRINPIWNSDAQGVNQYVDFIQDFTLDCFDNVKIYLSIDTQYTSFVNGNFAGFNQYSDYPENKVYDCLDITALVRKGANRLCIQGYYQGEDCATHISGVAGLIFAVVSGNQVVCCSGKDTLSRKSKDYECGPIEKFSPQLSFSFHYNAAKYDGWHDADYKITDDFTESVTINSFATYSSRPVKKLELLAPTPATLISQGIFNAEKTAVGIGERVHKAFLSYEKLQQLSSAASSVIFNGEPVEFKADRGEGFYLIIDLGEEKSGVFTIDIDIPEETLIEVGYGEHLTDLRVRASMWARNFAFSYRTKKGRQSFTHYFKRIGCRYLELHIFSKNATIYYAGLNETVYPLSYCESPDFKHRINKRIYDVGVHTLRLCMHEHYEDTPWREQALYAMDSRLQMLCGYYCFHEYHFARASLKLMAMNIRDDNLLELCSPGKTNVTIPFFSVMYLVALCEYVTFSGDTAFYEEVRPTTEKLLQSILEHETDGLLGSFCETEFWNFYEWTPGLDGGEIVRTKKIPQTIDAPLNAAWSKALQGMAYVNGLLGRKEEQDIFSLKSQNLNKHIHDMFYNFESKSYYTFYQNGKLICQSELATAMAVWCGACPVNHVHEVLESLKNPQADLSPISLSNQYFRYEALLSENENKEFVLADIERRWGTMLEHGATSFWETEDGESAFDNAGSLCHGWSAIPVYFYCAYGLDLERKQENPLDKWNLSE